MIVEILNSAIEAVVDRIGSFIELSGRAKTWDLRRIAGDYHRADHLGNAALVTFPISLEE
jgi:hypothetical protein